MKITIEQATPSGKTITINTDGVSVADAIKIANDAAKTVEESTANEPFAGKPQLLNESDNNLSDGEFQLKHNVPR